MQPIELINIIYDYSYKKHSRGKSFKDKINPHIVRDCLSLMQECLAKKINNLGLHLLNQNVLQYCLQEYTEI